MQHFGHLGEDQRAALFSVPPEKFERDAAPELLAVALGATLYTPATRPTIERDLPRAAAHGVMCSVLCLEDAIADGDVEFAEKNLAHQLGQLFESGAPRPLVFVRVRHPDQVHRLVEALGDQADGLDGFVVPKFTARSGVFLDAVAEASGRTGHRLWVMPVIESPEVFAVETRVQALVDARDLLHAHRADVLAVRIGATDLSSMLALRRPADITVYDVAPLASVIGDIVNVMGRRDGTGFVVTGPVWEHFDNGERLFKPQLRETPFTAPAERVLRRRLISKGLDGLIREVTLDHANGLFGKTVIHPSHVAAVHALSVVTHEDHTDALDVVEARRGGGVSASRYGNKMNEATPHTAWAESVLLRARAFGVAAEDVTFVDLLEAGVRL
ncbi:HpcH/HpaI aldolase/citrate lyase family protein [Nocardioides sp. ChNu-153]|uniref:HpcH/HpaI aldolase/citrate lyase family protein n=1 Tax=unclassified Nocardioides TaxID=2615069 RepID=UPI0024065EA9|nr:MULTISPECIES: HpcH/HpaI aldolase/citrate lyase family protein [unclassified Nocardioides]MDF9717505.1 HpcH/HpaI aldolase/citrate lyase family protein [Nocardioides sp. ChNu-99]MDN7120449.1 HpcH/HpaI aldolase/citrate lyase family protein [Nocardioides sp. ChNu-153]